MKIVVNGKVKGEPIEEITFNGATSPKQAKAEVRALYPRIRELKVTLKSGFQTPKYESC